MRAVMLIAELRGDSGKWLGVSISGEVRMEPRSVNLKISDENINLNLVLHNIDLNASHFIN